MFDDTWRTYDEIMGTFHHPIDTVVSVDSTLRAFLLAEHATMKVKEPVLGWFQS